MRKFIATTLAIFALSGAGFSQHLACANSETVRFKLISTHGSGINDCHYLMSYAQLAVEEKPVPGMSCKAPTKQGVTLEKLCSGSDMTLDIIYIKK